MQLALTEFDDEDIAVLEPSALIRGERAPEVVVICFFREVVDELAASGRRLDRTGMLAGFGVSVFCGIEHNGAPLGVLFPGVGAPLAVAAIEETIARGARRFVAVGGAGALLPDLVLGHAVVVDGAVRDEGTSFHYLPEGRELEADPAGVALLQQVLDERDIPYVTGKAWSTDGLYRETPARVARRRDEGCAVVEMEASAFFAVARHRNVKMAHLLYAGDSLAGDEWDHRGWHEASVRRDLFEAAADAALRLYMAERRVLLRRSATKG